MVSCFDIYKMDGCKFDGILFFCVSLCMHIDDVFDCNKIEISLKYPIYFVISFIDKQNLNC